MELSQGVVPPPPEPSVVVPSPPGAKPGAFQQISFTTTWLPRGRSELGMFDQALQSVFAFPLPTPDSPLILTPAFEVNYLDGPTAPDLPAQLYDASLQFRYLRKLTPRFGIDLAVTPGWHGDFDDNGSQAFRVPACALGAFDWMPELREVVLGVAFLDREDVDFLPVAGLIWTPDDDTRLELIVPKPRIARRFSCCCDVEEWWYIAGEFGGGSYAIRRIDGTQDVATLSDWRLLLGLEAAKPPADLTPAWKSGTSSAAKSITWRHSRF